MVASPLPKIALYNHIGMGFAVSAAYSIVTPHPLISLPPVVFGIVIVWLGVSIDAISVQAVFGTAVVWLGVSIGAITGQEAILCCVNRSKAPVCRHADQM